MIYLIGPWWFSFKCFLNNVPQFFVVVWFAVVVVVVLASQSTVSSCIIRKIARASNRDSRHLLYAICFGLLKVRSSYNSSTTLIDCVERIYHKVPPFKCSTVLYVVITSRNRRRIYFTVSLVRGYF